MNINFKRFDKSIDPPQYQTQGSAGFDLPARARVVVPPWTPTLIPVNVAVQIPKGYFLLLCSRSSMPKKKGLIVANSIGIIDHDYRGDVDEIGLMVINFTKKDVIVESGERLCHGLILPVERVEFVEKETFKDKNRGGFGTTGGY